MFIDTHCHLSENDDIDIDTLLTDITNNGVSKIILSFCTEKEMRGALKLVDQYSCVYATLGYHPSEASKVGEKQLTQLTLALNHPKVVGIGEIGLDYHYSKDNKKEQLTLFESQLQLALKYDLPVVIHSRDATQDTIDMLKQYPVRGIIHCFSGSLEVAKIYQELGFLLGIGGVVTFKNSNLPEVVKELPLTSLVLETDSPYLAPVPYRGQQNSSKYLPIIASKIAQLLNVSLETVAKVTTDNAIDVFDLDL